jgi:phage tail sheath protein FI
LLRVLGHAAPTPSEQTDDGSDNVQREKPVSPPAPRPGRADHVVGPGWQYVNVRRYLAYLEASIDRSTQWAVFEPNGRWLWDNARRTAEDFLLNNFANNRLLGTKPEQAFLVRCDWSTMTQNDLDNGRLVWLIGVCPHRPAEIVIFRIGHKTTDSIG